MDFINNDTLFYIILIILFLGFFLWNRSRTKRNREAQKNRNFRRRFEERKKQREKNKDDDTNGPSRTPFPPD